MTVDLAEIFAGLFALWVGGLVFLALPASIQRALALLWLTSPVWIFPAVMLLSWWRLG